MKATRAENKIGEMIDSFVAGLYADGTVARWEKQKKIAAVAKKHRKLNRSIKENQVILDCLNETQGGFYGKGKNS